MIPRMGAMLAALSDPRWRTVWLLGLVLLAVLGACLVGDDAWARVGGGQNFSTGGGSSSGSGGGGGGDGAADLIFLLIWLCIEYPAIGIPLTIIVVVVVIVRMVVARSGKRYVSRTHNHDEDQPWSRPAPGPAETIPGLSDLRAADAGFSMPVFLDYVQLLHRRATEAAVTRQWEPLLPFVSADARSALERSHDGIGEVRDVVAGGISVLRIARDGARFTVQLSIKNTRLERLADGRSRHVYVEEAWTLSRAADALSKAPEDAVRMGCPSCGSAIETDRQGQCTVCGTPIVEGFLQWTATATSLHGRRSVQAPTVGWTNGGAEPSVHVPTVADPQLAPEWRAFRGRHPGFSPDAFGERVSGVYFSIQQAWSDGRWADARPYVTDTLFQTLRFYLEQYTEHGLRNRLADIQLTRQQVVKVEIDAWYESITVRIWGSMRDWVENEDGKPVGGNARAQRQFSEYWTFIRAIGSGDETGAPTGCPSCGAPLDRVSQAGICGYCESKITTGRFDWVLSRIDQPEVYRG